MVGQTRGRREPFRPEPCIPVSGTLSSLGVIHPCNIACCTVQIRTTAKIGEAYLGLLDFDKASNLMFVRFQGFNQTLKYHPFVFLLAPLGD